MDGMCPVVLIISEAAKVRCRRNYRHCWRTEGENLRVA